MYQINIQLWLVCEPVISCGHILTLSKRLAVLMSTLHSSTIIHHYIQAMASGLNGQLSHTSLGKAVFDLLQVAAGDRRHVQPSVARRYTLRLIGSRAVIMVLVWAPQCVMVLRSTVRDGRVLTEVDKTPLVEFSLVQKNLIWTCQKIISRFDVCENLIFCQKICGTAFKSFLAIVGLC